MKEFEYKMSENMVKTILKQRKEKKAKGTPQEYLCEYVNDQLGIMGKCVKVVGI